MKTLKELAQDALDVQGASNLSGVVRAFNQVIMNIRIHYPDLSTTEFNRLPIFAMWADKIASLTGVQNMGAVEYSRILDEVDKLANS